MVKICGKCGIEFNAAAARIKFCSRVCGGNAKIYKSFAHYKAAQHQRRKHKDIDAHRAKRRENARKWRLKNLEVARQKVRDAARTRRARNPEMVRAEEKRDRDRHPGWRALLSRLNKRGITLDQFHAKCESQDFQCAICSADLLRLSDFSLDHDHSSGAFRGILCAPCNCAIGYFRDNTQTILSAARYLERLRQAGARAGVARSVEDLQGILKRG